MYQPQKNVFELYELKWVAHKKATIKKYNLNEFDSNDEEEFKILKDDIYLKVGDNLKYIKTKKIKMIVIKMIMMKIMIYSVIKFERNGIIMDGKRSI